jgi:methylated-DNA-[protein]-cysteine S-methyltransferase
MTPTLSTYEAGEWGRGTIWLEGGRLLWHELPRPSVAAAGAGCRRLGERFSRYFSGQRDEFLDVDLELDDPTPFQRAVLKMLRRIPYGETVTYGELAALAGYPNAQRAAGTFCAHNRFPIVVPCHRVVAADGLGSYGSLGLEYKRRLLELEGVSV